MGFTVVALALGIVLGLVAGGRPSNVGRRPLHAVMALAAAVVLQAVPQLLDIEGSAGLACVLASYALLVAFALANIRLVGMPVVLVGLLCNVVVIGANGGMPVRAEAILAVDRSAELAEVDFGSKRHLEDDSDRVTFLGDIIPVRPIRQVLSFGDLILSVGIADVVFRLLKPIGAVRRRRRPAVSEVLALLPAVTVTELRRSA